MSPEFPRALGVTAPDDPGRLRAHRVGDETYDDLSGSRGETGMRPRIALIHALTQSVGPIEAAFDRLWPEAERFNLLDDSLPADRSRHTDITPAIIDRFLAMGRYARMAGADGILFTCSAFGPAIEAVAGDLAPLPVHKPNAAMIEAAVAKGGKIGLLASFEPTLVSMLPEFPASAQVVTAYCAGALAALSSGDAPGHDRIVAETAQTLLACDVLALAQFSMARAAPAVHAATGLPVLTTPECAVLAVKQGFGTPNDRLG